MSTFGDSSASRLIDQAVRGDQRSLSRLLGRYRNRLKRMVLIRMDQRLQRRLDPSDIVQEALLTASQRFGEFAQQSQIPFYPWLRRLAEERLIDAYHHHVTVQKRSVQREASPLVFNEHSACELVEQIARSAMKSPSQQIMRDELHRVIRDALESLDSADREILTLRHLERLSVRKIAELMDLSESAVKMRRLRAMLRLRERLNNIQGGSQP